MQAPNTPATDAIRPLSRAERIEQALLVLAYLIELDGDVHLPMFERFEAELREQRQKEATRTRARELLDRYSCSGGVKAIAAGSLSGQTVASRHATRQDASLEHGVPRPGRPPRRFQGQTSYPLKS